MKPINLTTPVVTLFLLFHMAVATGIFTYVYQWQHIQELKTRIAKSHGETATVLIDKCHGQWTSWVGEGLLTGKDGVQVVCNETGKQSARRAHERKRK